MAAHGLKRWLIAGGAAAGAVAFGYELFTGRRRVEVTRRTYAVAGLPSDLDGLRLAHLSDLHVGPWTSIEFLERVVALTNAETPDLVTITGDYVDLDGSSAGPCAEALRGLRAPLGVFGILGNHDFEEGPAEIAAAVAARGIQVLRNRSVPLGEGPRHLWIVGLDDTVSHRGDLKVALAGVPPGEPVVLLSHSPDLIYRAADLGISLVLAGHTHGGQVRLPCLAHVYSPSRYGPRLVAGCYRDGQTRMVVNRGIGVTTFPVRFRCRPEVGLYSLVAPVTDAGATGRSPLPAHARRGS